MHETDDDLRQLQSLLDGSNAAAGPHLLEISTPDHRLTARQLCDRLIGMRLLVLATVTADGRPIAGPVDGIFFRGAFHYSSSPDAVRTAHIRRRPAVSATHLPGEEWAVTVHGTATEVDIRAPVHAALRRTVLDIYTPRYGEEWEEFLDANVVVRIDARRMFTYALDPGRP